MREDIKLWIKQFALESTGIHIDETISLIIKVSNKNRKENAVWELM